jgi:hypothetical protein
MELPYAASYNGAVLANPATGLIYHPAPHAGTLKAVFLDLNSASDGDAVFNLRLNGTDLFTTELTVADGTTTITVSGLSQALVLGDTLELVLDTMPTTLPAPPWGLVLTIDDGVAVSSGTGGFGFPGQDGEPGESWMIPGPVGPQGSTGATGAAGAVGPAGPIGLPGMDGEPGETILIPGAPGPAGATGATGSTGPSGQSGFMVAEDGPEGESFMIPGPTGPTGAGNIGKQTIYIPASAMIAATTNGPSSAQLESATNKLNYSVLDFDGTTQEYAHFQVAFPKSWDEGTVTFKPFWSTTNASTNGVAWGLQGIAASDNDTIDTAFGTAIYVVDNGQSSAAKQYIGAESAAVTIGGTPAAGDLCYFRVTRDPANGSDDMTQDARLHGIQLFYTTDAVNDA